MRLCPKVAQLVNEMRSALGVHLCENLGNANDIDIRILNQCHIALVPFLLILTLGNSLQFEGPATVGVHFVQLIDRTLNCLDGCRTILKYIRKNNLICSDILGSLYDSFQINSATQLDKTVIQNLITRSISCGFGICRILFDHMSQKHMHALITFQANVA